MSYRGRYQLGQYVALFCQCRDSNRTPTVPTAPPLAVIWGSTGAKLKSLEMPVLDRYVPVAGLFSMQVRLGPEFATGIHRVVYEYLAGTYHGLDEDTFEIVAGGNPDGNVIAMYYLDRPGDKFIVQELDSGRLVQGRNPK